MFGAGLPAGGARGTLALSASGVEVRAGDLARSAPTSALALREVGFGRPGVEIAWTEGEAQWVAHVLDPDAAQRVLSTPPLAGSPQARALAGARRTRSARRTFGWAALALFVLLPVLLLVTFFLQADRIAAWAVRRIPVETELRLGRAAFADLRRDLELQDSGAAYDAVQTLGARLAQGCGAGSSS